MYKFNVDRDEFMNLMDQYPLVYHFVYATIARIDPIDILKSGAPYYEYDLEVRDIVYNLQSCESPEQIREMVLVVFRHWFKRAGSLEHNQQFHHDLWSIRNDYIVDY